MDPRYRNTRLKLLGTRFSSICFRYVEEVSRYVDMNKWVRSYPFLVSFFLIGELSLSLGVSEPRHILEVTHYKHIGILGKAIEHHGI